jgi:type II secretory pathway pseudopilin PulG
MQRLHKQLLFMKLDSLIKMPKYKSTNGFSLVELLIAISFISVIVVLVFTITSFNSKLSKLNEQRTQALLYATEGIESIKLISWDNLNTGDFYPVAQGDTWALAAGSETIDNFTRTITISDVYRTDATNNNIHGAIVETGYLDPDTKKITVSLDWTTKTGSAKQEQLETYMHRWQADRWTQTDWVGGSGQSIWSDTSKFYTKDAGTEVTIPGIATLLSGFLDWNQATTTAVFNTPGNFDDNDVYELDGLAYLVTENNPSGAELYILDVNDIYAPFQLSSLNIGSSVTSVVVQGNYAYLSTKSDNSELQIIDVSNSGAPFVATTYNLSGNRNAQDVVVNENELYIIQYDDLYSFSITNPTSPQLLDSIDVDEKARELFLSENNIYIATEDDDKELQIIDVTNPANLQTMGEYDLPGSLKGTDVYVRGTRAYISTQNNGSGQEFFILNISDPSDPVLIGSYEVGEKVHSFTIIGPYALLGTNFLNEELLVLDVSYPATISQVSGFDLDGYVLGMSANCSVIYAATSNNQNEFFIISTEVFDCDYASSGTLESSTFDTGSDTVAYNWIAWTGSEPANTDIRFQIATSNNQAGPWTFIGPDGTNSTYYSTAAKELINYTSHLNQRYLRYKLFLTSQADLQTPILEEVTISYSTYP